jgi:hypothetical protein
MDGQKDGQQAIRKANLAFGSGELKIFSIVN